jgi:uncharacterized iron-regulated membrane protein
MDNLPVPPQKKGLGVGAWLGIGCGALIVILVIVGVIAFVFLGPRLKEMAPKFQQMAEEAKTNPTRAAVDILLMSGQFEMVKEDDTNKRYTVRQKVGGKMMTIYWDAKQSKAVTIEGDFSAIPKDANPPAAPAPQ